MRRSTARSVALDNRSPWQYRGGRGAAVETMELPEVLALHYAKAGLDEKGAASLPDSWQTSRLSSGDRRRYRTLHKLPNWPIGARR
jgi:hypothetical protein